MRIAIALLVAACSHPACPVVPAASPVPAAPISAPLEVHSNPRSPGDAPALDLDHALATARSYAKQHDVDLSRAYLQGAVFDAAARRWVFDWQLPNTKGGLTILYVNDVG
jgi:hypothetical protein